MNPNNSILSPIRSLVAGFSFMTLIISLLYYTGFYEESEYFGWGPPVFFFNKKVDSVGIFYMLLSLIFFHQLITNWIYEVVYPWVINTIQNPRQPEINYSKAICLTIINSNALYNQLHFAFLINGITSQISFLIALIIADFTTMTYINWHYMKNKSSPVERTEIEIV